MNTKRFTAFLLIFLLFAAMTACGKGDEAVDSGEDVESAPAAQEPASVVEGDAEGDEGETPVLSEVEVAVSEPSTNDESSSEPSAADEQPAPPVTDGLFADPNETLDSYRMTTDIQAISGEGMMFMGDAMHMEMAWVRNPPAQHTITGGILEDVDMETIVIGDQTWMNMGDGAWFETPTTDGGAGGQAFMTDVEDMLQEIQNNMVPKGKETVNGVNCQKYEVDADFTFAMPLPEDVEDPEMVAQFFPTEFVGHISGDIWIAAESGLPPVVIRSYTTQELTMKYESRPDETMVYEEKRDMTDINTPIAIEPPEDAAVTFGVSDAEVVSLDTLDSYRLEWGILMGAPADNTAMPLGNLVEWVREPHAVHVVLDIGGAFATELISVGGTTWVKQGDSWMETEADAAVDSYGEMSDTMELTYDAVFVDEETIDGIHCRHYVFDFQEMIHQEWWVADQASVPPVVIKTLFRMTMGEMITETHGRVYDINEPIVIEPPQ